MIVVSAALAALAVVVMIGDPLAWRHRLAAVSASTASEHHSTRSAPQWLSLKWIGAACGGLGVMVVVGGSIGVAAGVLTTLVVGRWLGQAESSSARTERRQLTVDLPVATDLLASCLLAGSPPDRALAAVSEAIGGPVGRRFSAVASNMRLGADPDQAWLILSDELQLRELARAVRRCIDSGAPLADAVARCADDMREERRWAVEAAARSVAVKAAGPLGICFLPAFVLVSVVPVVMGIAGAVLRGMA